MKKLIVPVLILVLLGIVFTWQQSQSLQANAQEDSTQIQTAMAETGWAGEPTRVVFPLSDKPPVLTEEERQNLEAIAADDVLTGPPLPVGTTAVQRADSVVSPDSEIHLADDAAFNPEAGINAPGTMVRFRRTFIAANQLGNLTSVYNTPTVANNSHVVFMAGNWWAAVSSNGGTSFQYIDPRNFLPPIYGGFWGNQSVIYDPSRDIFIWELEYFADGQTEGGFRIAVSRGSDAAKGIWHYYDFGAGPGYRYNFPDLSLSNDFLYVTSDTFTAPAGSLVNSRIIKLPLDTLAAGTGLSYSYVQRTEFNIRAVQGATEAIYWAAHMSTSQIRVFRWLEDGVTYDWVTIDLSVTWYDSARLCPGPDGKNWCGGLGNAGRVMTGWVSKGVIGFLWGSSQGGSYPYPYIEGVTLNEATMTYKARAHIWNGISAFIYPGVAINARGDRATVFNYGGNTLYPNVGYLVHDDFNTPNIYFPAAASTQGPDSNLWGRINTVRPFAPNSLVWVASGHVLNGCGADTGCVEPVYYVFGRERDMRSLLRYWELNFVTFLPITRR